MKTIFRNLGKGFLTVGLIAAAGISALAQDAPAATTAAADPCKDIEGQQASYKVFTDNIVKGATVEQRETAVKAGEEYVQKYGACPESKQIVDYMNTNLPKMRDGIATEKRNIIRGQSLTKFDAAAKAKNVAEVFTTGKEILGKEASFEDVALDVAITLASAGYDQAKAKPPVDKYNDDTITYAKYAISKLEAGKVPDAYGVYTYSLKPGKTSSYKDAKAYTLGALNYFIGDIMYVNQGTANPAKKKEALAYLYKATQYDSFAKTDARIYQLVGAWYLDEALRIEGERQKILTAMPEKDRKDNDTTLAMVGEQKGYADRAIDAYSRSYKLAKSKSTPDKAYVDNLYTRLKELYGFRFDGKIDNLDANIAKADTAPLPDPSTPITPVTVEPTEPTAPATTPPTTGTTPATNGATKPATGTTTTTKPATTPKPATAPSGETKPAGTSNTEATTTGTKNAVKKTTPKKKGTR